MADSPETQAVTVSPAAQDDVHSAILAELKKLVAQGEKAATTVEAWLARNEKVLVWVEGKIDAEAKAVEADAKLTARLAAAMAARSVVAVEGEATKVVDAVEAEVKKVEEKL